MNQIDQCIRQCIALLAFILAHVGLIAFALWMHRRSLPPAEGSPESIQHDADEVQRWINNGGTP